MINQRPITDAERNKFAKYTQKQNVRHYGHDSEVEPVLIGTVFGDGKKLLRFTPLATRPNYYLVLIDSSYDDEDSEAMENLFGEDYTDPILNAIEEEFGCYDDDMETPEDYCGDLYWQKVRWWPALNETCGSAWGLEAK